jgi:hypothetical protein
LYRNNFLEPLLWYDKNFGTISSLIDRYGQLT